ncbi:MAG: SPFH domain-containing protein [Verrucomicrobiota bacterium]|nr:SPFH domain-containing protein [Verrucomicrobiota bacterium]
MQEYNSKKIGFTNSITLLGITIGTLVLALKSGSNVGLAGLVILGVGTLISFFSFVHAYLIDREQQEALEMQALDQTRDSDSLFSGAAEDAYPALNARRQFERWIVPSFTSLLLVAQVLGIWLISGKLNQWTSPDPGQAQIPILFNSLFVVVLFLMGKYSAGLARMDGQQLLRPGASYMLLGAVLGTAIVLSETASYFGYPLWDKWITWLVFIIIITSAVENVVTLVLEIYRPKGDKKKARLLYDSRLIGLLGQPGGLISTAAHALDYQFGFKVSETWFYRYLEQKLALILGVQFVVLFFSSSFVVIQANEKALLERFGKNTRISGPGFLLKWPWPIDKVYRYKTDEIQSFTLGIMDKKEEEHQQEGTKVILWTTQHNHGGSDQDPEQNFNMIVASNNADAQSAAESVPVNLLTVSIPMQYRINDLNKWVTNNANSGSLLQKLAMREVTQYLIGVDMDELMGPGRTEAQKTLKDRLQNQSNEHNLGAEIVFVGLQDIHPPVGKNEQSKETGGVAESYEKVIVAQLNAETNRLVALMYDASKVPLAEASAAESIAKAKSDSTNKVAIAEAEAKRFANQIAAFKSAPSVYKTRMKLESFKEATKGSRKYILSDPANRDVINLELQDQLRQDLLNVTVDQEN